MGITIQEKGHLFRERVEEDMGGWLYRKLDQISIIENRLLTVRERSSSTEVEKTKMHCV